MATLQVFLHNGSVHDQMHDDVEKMIHSLVENLSMTAEKLEEMKSATGQDKVLQRLTRFVKDGWPSARATIPLSVSHYWKVQDEIYELNGSQVNYSRETSTRHPAAYP